MFVQRADPQNRLRMGVRSPKRAVGNPEREQGLEKGEIPAVRKWNPNFEGIFKVPPSTNHSVIPQINSSYFSCYSFPGILSCTREYPSMLPKGNDLSEGFGFGRTSQRPWAVSVKAEKNKFKQKAFDFFPSPLTFSPYETSGGIRSGSLEIPESLDGLGWKGHSKFPKSKPCRAFRLDVGKSFFIKRFVRPEGSSGASIPRKILNPRGCGTWRHGTVVASGMVGLKDFGNLQIKKIP